MTKNARLALYGGACQNDAIGEFRSTDFLNGYHGLQYENPLNLFHGIRCQLCAGLAVNSPTVSRMGASRAQCFSASNVVIPPSVSNAGRGTILECSSNSRIPAIVWFNSTSKLCQPSTNLLRQLFVYSCYIRGWPPSQSASTHIPPHRRLVVSWFFTNCRGGKRI